MNPSSVAILGLFATPRKNIIEVVWGGKKGQNSPHSMNQAVHGALPTKFYRTGLDLKCFLPPWPRMKVNGNWFISATGSVRP